MLFSFAWLVSEGEPVCEGPLILSVEDTYPLGCDGPSGVIPVVLGLWFVTSTLVGVVSWVLADP